MSAATQTTNTAVTKKKLPMDRVFVQFECYQQSEKTDATGKTETIFEYKPIHSYKLYLFYKKNDQFFRMPDNGITGNVAIAQPIATLDDHPEYLIPEADVGKCNYAFKKGATYYGYFAGRELSEAEVTALRGERSYVLLKMVPTATGVLRIDQSLFWWICLLQQLEVGLSGNEALTKINAIYKSDFSDLTTDLEKKLNQTENLILTNGGVTSIDHLFQAVMRKKQHAEPIWGKKLAETIVEATRLYGNSTKTGTDALYSFEMFLESIRNNKYNRLHLQSQILGEALGEIILGMSETYILNHILEDFFYKSNFSELANMNTN